MYSNIMRVSEYMPPMYFVGVLTSEAAANIKRITYARECSVILYLEQQRVDRYTKSTT